MYRSEEAEGSEYIVDEVTWKGGLVDYYDIQSRVAELREQTKDTFLDPPLMHTVLFLVSEIGEVCNAVMRLQKGEYLRGREAGSPLHQDLAMEIGDTLLMLATLTTQHNIDLNEALTLSIEKIRRRVTDARIKISER